jgi:hypothetical protein
MSAALHSIVRLMPLNSKVEQIESRTASWNGLCSTSECPLYSGSTFEFLFEFQTEFFSNFLFRVSSCSRIKPFDFRGSTVYWNGGKKKWVTNWNETFSAVNLKFCFPLFSGRFAVANWNKWSPTADRYEQNAVLEYGKTQWRKEEGITRNKNEFWLLTIL